MIEYKGSTFEKMTYEQITLDNLLQGLGSAITLDIAPGHTGIVIWDGNQLKTCYFKLTEPNKQDAHWLYLLRREFKEKLRYIVQGQTYQYCLVEDVYGGENYDTVIQLVTLNNVIDELMFDGVCKIETFYRLKPTSWMAKARQIYKQEGKLKSKIETQGLLEYLKSGYYLAYKDLSNKQKEDICFEDICDAHGMLVAIVAMNKLKQVEPKAKKGVRFSDVKMLYVEHLEDSLKSRNKRFREEKTEVKLRKNIQDSIMSIVEGDTEQKVFYAYLPVNKLGAFGMKHKFTFYPSGEGYLIFYANSKNKN